MSIEKKEKIFQIVGGEAATINDIPYQCQLIRGQSFMCGAIVLAADTILSAAHCFHHPPTEYSVICGSDQLGVGERINVTEGFMHPLYDPSTKDNDAYILKLANGFTNYEGGSIKPVVLPVEGRTLPEKTPLIVSGFGTTSEGGHVSYNLMKVELPFISAKKCQWFYLFSKITERMICAGILPFGGKDSCQGS